jgi:hypothetical protein
MNKWCPKLPSILGCAHRSSDGSYCLIVRANDAVIRGLGYTPELVLRHEIGHCAGLACGSSCLGAITSGPFVAVAPLIGLGSRESGVL